MSRQIQLAIPGPCHENWDDMTPLDRGRFCNACSKKVIDFTHMSDSQLAAFFRKAPADGVCGRFFNGQLDRDIEIPAKKIPWIKYFFQFALPAFLMSAKAAAQGNVKPGRQHTTENRRTVNSVDSTLKENAIARMLNDQAYSLDITVTNFGPLQEFHSLVKPVPQLIGEIRKITGRVTNESGDPLQGVVVSFKGTNVGTITNVFGEFTLGSATPWKSVTLIIASIGYEPKEITVTNDQATGLPLQATMTPAVVITSMQVAVAGMVVCKKPASKKRATTIPQLKQKLMDTAYKFFRAFPNPALAGASLHIEWKQTEEGYYVFELIDLSGKKVYSKEIWIDAEARLLNLELPSVAAGNYILQATHKNSGTRFAEKIVIE